MTLRANRTGAARATALACFCSTLLLCIAQEPPPALSKFSQQPIDGRLPAGWKALTFPKVKQHTRYELVRDTNTTVVRAVSRTGASGLIAELNVSATEYPVLEWRWKAENLLIKGDPTRKDGDDYPARIYVTFRYDPARASLWQRTKYGAARLAYGEYPPHAALSYIWDAKTPLDTILPNAYTDRLQMVVVESGPDRLGQWLAYRRNLLEDYRRAFKEDPPPISGIAIMTDTDNTGESAITYYGDISLKRSD